jgi:hypothetical protein
MERKDVVKPDGWGEAVFFVFNANQSPRQVGSRFIVTFHDVTLPEDLPFVFES